MTASKKLARPYMPAHLLTVVSLEKDNEGILPQFDIICNYNFGKSGKGLAILLSANFSFFPLHPRFGCGIILPSRNAEVC
jgi:hypothetical protein